MAQKLPTLEATIDNVTNYENDVFRKAEEILVLTNVLTDYTIASKWTEFSELLPTKREKEGELYLLIQRYTKAKFLSENFTDTLKSIQLEVYEADLQKTMEDVALAEKERNRRKVNQLNHRLECLRILWANLTFQGDHTWFQDGPALKALEDLNINEPSSSG
jgi:hypothetical protein